MFHLAECTDAVVEGVQKQSRRDRLIKCDNFTGNHILRETLHNVVTHSHRTLLYSSVILKTDVRFVISTPNDPPGEVWANFFRPFL